MSEENKASRKLKIATTAGLAALSAVTVGSTLVSGVGLLAFRCLKN